MFHLFLEVSKKAILCKLAHNERIYTLPDIIESEVLERAQLQFV
ncbi:hypothetical protein LEP1GSC112_0327 [Leptospira interrogans serovar Pomona str. UT364]|nr:hypothetical protein LEP1GSC112_0327 [Leptospira interrogans serovar Pomona str. UT364]